MQCKVNSDPTIAVCQAQPAETFVVAHPSLSGVVLTRLSIQPDPRAVVCVVIASAQPDKRTGEVAILPAQTRVISVAPRQMPEFVALEG